jgi:acyl-CoA hydrolase
MPSALTFDTFRAALRPGLALYWPGAAAHSALFERWWHACGDGTDGVQVGGVWIPGVNRFDPTAVHPGVRAAGLFVTPELRAAWQRGAFDLTPWHYSEAALRYADRGRFDLALVQVAPPDAEGQCSLGLAADFAPAVLAGGARCFAHLNPRLPRTAGPSIAASRIEAWVESDEPLLHPADEPADAVLDALARVVAAEVHDGDTVQLGLGRFQSAVLTALRGHRGLRVHGGMVTDGLLGLAEAGALAPPDPTRPPVCTGVALGSAALYARVAEHALVRFAPVSHTHALPTLAAIPNLVAINSALQVDLFGNVNAEVIDGRQVSGIGGLADFVRGARASAGGRAIVALPATARGASRIVAQLPAGAVSVPRADVDIVATEHGLARLRGLPLQSRADALISIAAPEHRAGLAQAWHTLKSQR